MTLPDPDTELLLRARTVVEEAIEAFRSETRHAVSLFLEPHYPFFDANVQKILLERHPQTDSRVREAPWYPVDAYLWAEQHVWIAYSDDLFIGAQPIEEQSNFYFAKDIRWFCRLLVAAAEVVETIIAVPKTGALVNHETRLQAWRNWCSERKESPTEWLQGTGFLQNAKQRAKGQEEDPRASIRVTASAINKRRRQIFSRWLPSWESELQHLAVILESGPR